MWLVFTLLGRFCLCEMHAATGRVDVVVATERYVYVMGLKRDGAAAEALVQLGERGYEGTFATDRAGRFVVPSPPRMQLRRPSPPRMQLRRSAAQKRPKERRTCILARKERRTCILACREATYLHFRCVQSHQKS